MTRLDPVDVMIVQACPRTGKTLSSKRLAATSVAYLIDEQDAKVLCVGREAKTMQEFAVVGGVKVLSRLASEGKATLTLVRRNIQLMLTANPDDLVRWLRSLANPAGTAAPTKRSLGPLTPSRANSSGCSSPSDVGAAAKKGRDHSPGSVTLSPRAQQVLTGEQQAVLVDVLAGRNVYLTGGAGVGKSFTLKELVRRLPPSSTVITASTGIAACGIGGVTVHSWAGLSASGRPLGELIAQSRKKRASQWRAAKTLVIDEISMLDGRTFDELEAIARAVRGIEKPFGGLQLVLCGDFFQVHTKYVHVHAHVHMVLQLVLCGVLFQVPCVRGEAHRSASALTDTTTCPHGAHSHCSDPVQLPPVATDGAFTFAFEAASWASCVERVHQLTHVFRQSDAGFVAALNLIRLGRAGPAVRALLSTCEGRQIGREDGIVATRLCTHKAECAQRNETALDELGGTALTFTARDAGDDAALATLRASCPAPAVLKLKPGAQVILTKTLDAESGLVNGARGVVVKMLSTRNPSVRFFNGIERIVCPEAHTLTQAGQTIACRTQLPLALGWAISVRCRQSESPRPQDPLRTPDSSRS